MSATFPGILGEIADVAGEAAAIQIAQAKGGVRVSIPARAPDGHWLVEAVGRNAADKICAHFRTLAPEGYEAGARHVVIPLGPGATIAQAKARLARALEDGASVREAARRAGLHERTAWWVKASLSGKEDDDQGRLF